MTEGPGISIHVYGEEECIREIRMLRNRVIDAAPGFKQVANYMREHESRQFATEGHEGGDPWAKLKPISEKGRKGGLILQATERLKNSLTEEGGEHVEEALPDRLMFGSDVPYAIYHHMGTRSMPKRDPLQTTALQRRRMSRILTVYIRDGRLASWRLAEL